jgi:DNA-binding Lrp family transcriptional regulator
MGLPELIEYLNSKGGVGLLVVLSDGAKQYKEIKEELAISRGTIGTRRDEAIELGLLIETMERVDNRTTTKYGLTRSAIRLVFEFRKFGLVDDYRKMREYQRRFEDDIQNVIEWMDEEGGYDDMIDDFEASIEDNQNTSGPQKNPLNVPVDREYEGFRAEELLRRRDDGPDDESPDINDLHGHVEDSSEGGDDQESSQ